MRKTVENAADYVAGAGARAWEVPGIGRDLPRRPVRSVGILGAGTMGGGIAMNFATAGIPVKILETTQQALDRGLGIIRGNYQRSADKGRFTQDELEARMGRIEGVLDMASLAECDLIIEAVFEDIDLKKKIFADLDAAAKAGAILATNTSALDIDEIASVTSRPQDVIGLHFFSPANVMKLLEIVRARHTADDVVATGMDLAKTIGKVAVLVGVCWGFVGNRMLRARRLQAEKLMFSGVMPWDIDKAINDFGFRMGPFQMSDLAGLDIGWAPGKTTEYPVRDALCEMGRRGQKTAAGWYDYEGREGVPSEVTARVIREITGARPRQVSADEIVTTCLYPMVNEGVRILQENKAQRPSDIDVVWLNGYGWPAETGGPMYWADKVGAAAILAKMEALGAEDAGFAPAEGLRRLSDEGGSFLDLDFGGLKTIGQQGKAA
ncbi:3-hydroxyacyl-CoA dehydrogenase [Breoghania corrubedonensis]|uniref:3-hydroxyacyl-CoA dehydrogenase n=1 Tax=Breoghania corrubedonensis TaxID=665038 RepID=A0A2T5US62_9HYPH|nr:3-hydroxyacyl-CoA dehydrogenase [Breoghania corrubedonensis]PTW54357.1 3-hydroxyacyl-CoA dehydrogenase [Breoghania corrubedonensis]